MIYLASPWGKGRLQRRSMIGGNRGKMKTYKWWGRGGAELERALQGAQRNQLGGKEKGVGAQS